MRRNDAQSAIAKLHVGVDRTTRLVISYAQIERAGRKHRKPGEYRIAEPPAMIVHAGAENHAAAGCFTQISPLIGRSSDARAGIHLLQACNVGIDLAQDRDYSVGIVASVDTDAGMNVVGDYPNRGCFLGEWGAGGSAIVRHHPRPVLARQSTGSLFNRERNTLSVRAPNTRRASPLESRL